MTKYDRILFNFDGSLRIRRRPISNEPRYRVNQCNLINGARFARQIAAGFQLNAVKVVRHPAGRRYPCTLSVFLGDTRLALLCKFWTKTPNRGEAFYPKREFYESRRRGRYPDQIAALMDFSRDTGALPFLVAGLELPSGRHAVFVPFNYVETLLKYESKIGLAAFSGWPSYPLKDDFYDIDVAELKRLITNLRADEEDQEAVS